MLLVLPPLLPFLDHLTSRDLLLLIVLIVVVVAVAILFFLNETLSVAMEAGVVEEVDEVEARRKSTSNGEAIHALE